MYVTPTGSGGGDEQCGVSSDVGVDMDNATVPMCTRSDDHRLPIVPGITDPLCRRYSSHQSQGGY